MSERDARYLEKLENGACSQTSASTQLILHPEIMTAKYLFDYCGSSVEIGCNVRQWFSTADKPNWMSLSSITIIEKIYGIEEHQQEAHESKKKNKITAGALNP